MSGVGDLNYGGLLMKLIPGVTVKGQEGALYDVPNIYTYSISGCDNYVTMHVHDCMIIYIITYIQSNY